MFTQAIYNGDVMFEVTIENSDIANRSYSLNLRAVYPDGTVVTENYQQEGDESSRNRMVTFGEFLFGRLDVMTQNRRIDILNNGIIYSIFPETDDQCYMLTEGNQVVYSGNALLSEDIFSSPQLRKDAIYHLLVVDRTGTQSLFEETDRLFEDNGALLCVSPSTNRAFYTTVDFLIEDIQHYFSNITMDFIAPMIEPSSMTIESDSRFDRPIIILGDDIRAIEMTQVEILINLTNPGDPRATDVEWTFNGAPLVTDSGKGVFITNNGFGVLLNQLASNNAGVYTATVSNPAGSDTASTSVTVVPESELCDF